MTTHKEVLKLALEVIQDYVDEYGPHDKDSGAQYTITAIKEALAQPEQEPLEYWNAVEGWVKIDEVREHFDSVGCGTIYKTAGEGREPLYTTPPQRKPLTEWQPIETAPKNSTSILIYCPRSERKPVCEAWWAIAYEGDHGGHWQTPIGPNGRGYTILETAPTHWMPLPTPPIEAAHGITKE